MANKSSKNALAASSLFQCSLLCPLLLAALLLVVSRPIEAKPKPGQASAVAPGAGNILDIPFQTEDGQAGDLVLEPVPENEMLMMMGQQQQQQPSQSYWILRQPGRAANAKRGSLGPRPLRFGRR